MKTWQYLMMICCAFLVFIFGLGLGKHIHQPKFEYDCSETRSEVANLIESCLDHGWRPDICILNAKDSLCKKIAIEAPANVEKSDN